MLDHGPYSLEEAQRAPHSDPLDRLLAVFVRREAVLRARCSLASMKILVSHGCADAQAVAEEEGKIAQLLSDFRRDYCLRSGCGINACQHCLQVAVVENRLAPEAANQFEQHDAESSAVRIGDQLDAGLDKLFYCPLLGGKVFGEFRHSDRPLEGLLEGMTGGVRRGNTGHPRQGYRNKGAPSKNNHRLNRLRQRFLRFDDRPEGDVVGVVILFAAVFAFLLLTGGM